MKTFTNCAEKKAKQILNLLQGYTKGIRMTAILVLLLMGVSNAWGAVVLRYQEGMPSGNYDGNTSKTMTQSSANDDRYYCEISLTANSSYGFFIINGSNYYKVNVTATSNNSVQLYDYGSSNYGESNHRVTYKSGTAGTYIFTYDASNHKICVSPKSSETIKIAYDVAQGHDGDWNLNNYVNLTQVGSTANYTIDLDLQAKKYYMFVQISNGIYWRAGSTLNVDGSASLYYYGTTNYGESGDKINFTPSTAGKYRFTWNHQDKTIKLEPFYSVIYNGNSHTSGSVPTTSLHLNGSTVTVASNSGNLARTGYTFGGWNTNSTGTGTNYTAGSGSFTMGPSNTTLYAKWTENKYPVNITANPAEAAKTLTPGPKSVGIKAVSIATTAKVGYTFKNWTATAGITIANANNASTTITATKAGTVTANFEAQPATTIYLEPTGFWNSHNAKFIAHVWNASGADDITMKVAGEGTDKYYTCEVPYGYTDVVFFRVDPSNTSTIWNQTNDLEIPIDKNTLYEIKSTGDKTFGQNGYEAATGEWKEANLIYTITLGYCDFGTYGIKYNGQSYFSKPKENVTIDVPAGAQIEILEGQPFSNAYTGDVVKKQPTNEKLITGQTLTINGDVTLDDNFVTKKPHVVYLGIPDEINTTEIWDKADKANFIYTWDTYASYGLVASTGNFRIDALGITYYKFTIPQGRHSFRFQRKSSLDDKGTPHCESVSLEHEIPLTDVNCFTLKNEKDDNRYKGTWGVLPAQPGDYRLLYVEQVVEKSTNSGDEWKTVITRKKAHPSNIVRNSEITAEGKIVSLHTYKERKYQAIKDPNATNDEDKYYTSSSNSEIILQKYNGTNWDDMEWHMVYGPLETLPIMANLPGRRNTVREELYYDNGIEIIKKDLMPNGEPHPDQGNGVWNFYIINNGTKVTLDLNRTHRYEGQYYIRTDNAEGGWDQYTLNDNYMTYSQYAKDHSGFSHYFCRWVEKNITPNTKFVIANDHGVAISDTLAGDQFTDKQGNIQENANIRWSWNEATNEIARAYIQGAFGDGGAENENILLDYTTDGTTDANDVILFDTGDWIYSIDVTVKVGSTLKSITATYPKITHTIDSKTINPIIQTFEEGLPMLTGGESANTYTVRVLYDFKIDKTLVALVPNEHKAEIGIDVLMERIDQKPMTTQVQAGITSQKDEGEGSTVYGVMTFTKLHLTGQGTSEQEKLTYWISFPFDVRLSDIFGFGAVGKYWMIKFYDGASRAANGLYDDNTYWKFITNSKYVLKANQGYVLSLDKKVMDPNSTIYTNRDKISLYFPSKGKITNINKDFTTKCDIPEHKCEIKSPTDRTIYDSNWNLIGVPSYGNHKKETNAKNVTYFYDYDHKSDSYTVAKNAETKTFQAMFAYMVQFAGTINWETFTFTENGAQGLAAKKANAAYNQHNLRLELQQSGSKLDHTFIQLQDEEATEMFDMNSDLCKIINAGSNIYSIITTESTPIQVAGNVMPIQETIIPIGVVTSAAGEHTFAMPDGTDGIVVELIDYETNTTTNMLLDNYTVNLGKGTFENRFALHVKPNKTTTSLVDVNTNSNGVKKYLIDGVLYMQKDGVLYDAQGKLVR